MDWELVALIAAILVAVLCAYVLIRYDDPCTDVYMVGKILISIDNGKC